MSFIGKNYDIFRRILPIFIVLVLILQAEIPQEYIHTTKNKVMTATSEQLIKLEVINFQKERVKYLTAYIRNEILNDIEANLTITQIFRDYKTVIVKIFNIFLPLTSYGVFAYCLGYFILRRKQLISIMATFIGGHAPPNMTGIQDLEKTK